MRLVLKLLGFVWVVSFLSYSGIHLYVGSGGEVPPSALQYANDFRIFLDTCLGSSWFLVVLVCLWFFASYKISKDSGWQSLAKKFEQGTEQRNDLTYHTGNGYIGKIRYNGILQIAATPQGLYLKVLFLFKLGHKDLFIPWCDIVYISTEKGLFHQKTPRIVKSIARTFHLATYLNIKLKYFSEQRLVIQAVGKLLDQVPSDMIRQNPDK